MLLDHSQEPSVRLNRLSLFSKGKKDLRPLKVGIWGGEPANLIRKDKGGSREVIYLLMYNILIS